MVPAGTSKCKRDAWNRLTAEPEGSFSWVEAGGGDLPWVIRMSLSYTIVKLS